MAGLASRSVCPDWRQWARGHRLKPSPWDVQVHQDTGGPSLTQTVENSMIQRPWDHRNNSDTSVVLYCARCKPTLTDTGGSELFQHLREAKIDSIALEVGLRYEDQRKLQEGVILPEFTIRLLQTQRRDLQHMVQDLMDCVFMAED
ncbi:hypothetical protein NDU88_003194 [Pleurodeles waltl]|uniref:Uncharacterized protein n=1 Tax=Pleurodeles waltl TaxID=8319 RepID=A0AAV7MSQ7_PLEWA|nr:hypothetical protein NDU88_003194 [Pleurodeles waltl]